MKRLLTGLAFAGLLLAGNKAGSKTYTFTVSEKSTIGAAQLKPGEYRMKLEGSEAVFSDDQYREIAKTNVTVSTVDKKFSNTELLCSQGPDSAEKIDAIELGGTKLKVQLDQ